MRKTSDDGGDTSSIKSSVENEVKKSLSKAKKNSIKRKAQNLSNESDETVIEPLLQKDKNESKNAKYTMPKTNNAKTDLSTEKNVSLNMKQVTTTTAAERELSDGKKEKYIANFSADSVAPIHNHMNTNVFSDLDSLKGLITPKTHILVELDETKQSGYIPSPLIFTTAKIHTDGKTKNMEPVQVTPVPILSTVEVKGKGRDITPIISTSSGGSLGNNILKEQNPNEKTITPSSGLPAESTNQESKLVTSQSKVNTSLNRNIPVSSNKFDCKSTADKDTSKSIITSELNMNSAASPSLFHDNIRFKEELQSNLHSQSSSTIPTNVKPTVHASTISCMQDPKNKVEKPEVFPTKAADVKQQNVPDLHKNIKSITSTETGTSSKADQLRSNTKNIPCHVLDTASSTNIKSTNKQMPSQKDLKIEDNAEKKTKISDNNDLSNAASSQNTVQLPKSIANNTTATAVTCKPLILSTTVQSSAATCTISLAKVNESLSNATKAQPGTQTKINSETKQPLVNPPSQSANVVTAISKNEFVQVPVTTSMKPTTLTKPITTNNLVSKPSTTSVLTKPASSNTIKKVTATLSTVHNTPPKPSTVNSNTSTKPTTTINASTKAVVTTNAPTKSTTTNNTSTKLAITTNAVSKPTVTTKSVTTGSTSKGVVKSAGTTVPTISVKPLVTTGKPISTKVTSHGTDKGPTSAVKSTAGSTTVTKGSTTKASSIPVTTKAPSSTSGSAISVKPSVSNKNNEQKSNEPSSVGKNVVGK